jgi:hypothetical protein
MNLIVHHSDSMVLANKRQILKFSKDHKIGIKRPNTCQHFGFSFRNYV